MSYTELAHLYKFSSFMCLGLYATAVALYFAHIVLKLQLLIVHC